MDNRVLSKQDNFSRRTYEPLKSVLLGTFLLIESQFLHSSANRMPFVLHGCTNVMVTIDSLLKRDSARFQ